MQVRFDANPAPQAASLLLPLFAGPASHLDGLDRAGDGLLRRVLHAAKFDGSVGRTVDFYLPDGAAMRRVHAFGLGEVAAADPRAAGAAFAPCWSDDMGDDLDLLLPPETDATFGASFAFGAALGLYRFARYKTVDAKTRSRALCIRGAKPDEGETAYRRLQAVADAVRLARDLTNEPPNKLTPTAFGARCRELERVGIVVEILDATALEALGMGALLGVARGSDEPPAVAVLSWRGAEGPPLALLGKGVTFDSGGLLPKGPEEMWDMKNDMGGAAAVVGAMQVLAQWQAKVHVVGILGLVENMPSGHAQRPGDVVRSMSGQTVEVLHTDAEGRLVLADLIAYARQRFAPAAMVDIATLTGSVTTVLAQEFAGLFSNDDTLSSLLLAAGDATGERVWRLPLCDGFDRLIDSPIADMQNITKGRMGGSATAAQFLHRFVGTTPWAHLDIAGVAWKKDAPPGGTGFGVQLLAEFAARRAAQS